MSAEFEGFYAFYFTGATGSSFGLLTFKKGIIVGVDVGGGKYDGTYTLDTEHMTARCIVDFVLTLGNQSITGAMAVTEPIRISVPVVLPIRIDPTTHHRIETPIGPINARFERLRGY
jgi:hypothetical protein